MTIFVYRSCMPRCPDKKQGWGQRGGGGDGEVLVVLELAVAEDLREQGLARELVNRWVTHTVSNVCRLSLP